MKQYLREHTRAQISAGMLRTGLVMFYAVLIICSSWLLKDYSAAYTLKRIIPYGIPPLLSLLSAVFLSLFVLNLEEARTESLLFAVICMVFAVLNLDIFLLGIISDPNIALTISRIDHFFLALLLLGTNLHLVFLVCEKKKQWWLVYLAYAIGIAMMPFTPTKYYFQGIYTYYWGFFAKKAFLYDVMSAIWLAGTIYGIFLLSRAYRRTADAHKKDTIKFIILGFLSSAILSLTNTPAIYGHEIYPLGTFIFIALFLLAYGLFKYNLRMAIQQVREGVFSIGVLAIITFFGCIPWLILPEHQHQAIKVISGILLVALFYNPVSRTWDLLLNLVIKRSSDLLQKEYYALTFRLSSINHIADIYQQVGDFLFKVMANSRCAMVFYNKDNECYEGWCRYNIQSDSGFFKSSSLMPNEEQSLQIPSDHPILLKLFSTNPPLVTHSIIGRWMAEMKIAADPSDWVLQAGIIIPIYSKSKIISLLIVENKTHDRSYSTSEKEIYRNLGVFLGPIIENANLLEGLENLVEIRTADLHRALEDANQKSNKIIENNQIITRQNHIFLSLFETSTKIHEIKELNELFDFTLTHLRSLFPNLGFGIILEGERVSIFESGAFQGMTDAECAVILKNRVRIEPSNINRVMHEQNADASRPPEIVAEDEDAWAVLPMRARDNRNIGKMIIKGKSLDPFAENVISIFLAQVSSAAQTKFLLRRLEAMASTDGLTGAANRSCFDQEYEKAIKNSTLFPDIRFSLLIIDINGLKKINDSYGHLKGDEMIKTVAKFLKTICRATDVLSRIGGDEFAILLPSVDSREAQHVLSRIRHKEKDMTLLCTHREFGEVRLPIRISIGIAGSDETPPETVMKLADDRMYQDKEIYYQQVHKGPSPENP